MGSSVCALSSVLPSQGLCYFQMRLFFLGVLSFLLPSFPAPPTLKAGSNHRVAVSVVGQQAALVARRQLWQSPAPPQLLCCGRVSQEALWLWDRHAEGEEETGSGAVLVSRQRGHASWPLNQSLPTWSGMSSRRRASAVSCGRAGCSLAVWASARAHTGSCPGLPMFSLQGVD